MIICIDERSVPGAAGCGARFVSSLATARLWLGVTVGCTAITLSSQARADWEFTRWGMTEAQVISASRGAARPDPSAGRCKREPDEFCVKLRMNTQWLGMRVDTRFAFDSQDKLVYVSVVAHAAPTSMVESALRRAYGPPSPQTDHSTDILVEEIWFSGHDQIAALGAARPGHTPKELGITIRPTDDYKLTLAAPTALASDGPFGIIMGKPPSLYHCETVPAGTHARCTRVPRPHVDLVDYYVVSHPKVGICVVSASTAPIQGDNFGGAVRSSVDDIAGEIARTYGSWSNKTDVSIAEKGGILEAPDHWMIALALRKRFYSFDWKVPTHKNNVDSISVTAWPVDSGRAQVLVEFESRDKWKCDVATKADKSRAF